jgi:outer membrane lipoprotein-sorting protein
MRSLFLALICIALPISAFADAAQDIVAKADKVRNPARSFRATSTLVEYRDGRATDKEVLVVYSKLDPATNQFRDLVRYEAPPRDAGKMVLLGGAALWFYDPASKASVRISPQQRLLGQAAVGDILTVNLASDYSAALSGEEKIEDASRIEKVCWRLDMKATSPTATYNRIEYWVEQSTFNPIKAKFYADSGRLLKVLYYRDFKIRLGALRPSEAVIIDAVDSSRTTVVQFGDAQFQDIPDAWFQRDYLPHLKAE